MDDQARIIKTISLYPDQEAILIKAAKEFGLGSLSAAVRFVINDWVKTKGTEFAAPQPDYPAN